MKGMSVSRFYITSIELFCAQKNIQIENLATPFKDCLKPIDFSMGHQKSGFHNINVICSYSLLIGWFRFTTLWLHELICQVKTIELMEQNWETMSLLNADSFLLLCIQAFSDNIWPLLIVCVC